MRVARCWVCGCALADHEAEMLAVAVLDWAFRGSPPLGRSESDSSLLVRSMVTLEGLER